MSTGAEFDRYAEDYDAALARGLSVSGEDKNYFARGRARWLAQCLRRMGEAPESLMDFGCGTGSSIPFLLDHLEVGSVLGVDVSPKSIERARRTQEDARAQFLRPEQYEPDEQFDLVFCNGTFHHIPPGERDAAVDYIHRSLRPGGLFALWENNPWNPGTRYVMSRCPFDQDAVTLTPPEARALVRRRGFGVLSTDFLFIFPRTLRWFRRIEPHVARLPLGTQYQVLCRKLSDPPSAH
ncbi:MAG: class I SAM-dependent methyltransferase [Pyrinomonadaceae bacterium]